MHTYAIFSALQHNSLLFSWSVFVLILCIKYCLFREYVMLFKKSNCYCLALTWGKVCAKFGTVRFHSSREQQQERLQFSLTLLQLACIELLLSYSNAQSSHLPACNIFVVSHHIIILMASWMAAYYCPVCCPREHPNLCNKNKKNDHAAFYNTFPRAPSTTMIGPLWLGATILWGISFPHSSKGCCSCCYQSWDAVQAQVIAIV